MTMIIYSDARNNAAPFTGGGVFIFPARSNLCTNGDQDASVPTFDKGENNA